MKVYQERLLELLVQTAWELEEIVPEAEWWATEHWRLKSTGTDWGALLWITFLVDPQYDGTKKESAVWAIAAAAKRPADRLEAERQIALQALSRGHYDERVGEFVRTINADRNRGGA
jgi:hypothetical protein